MKLSVFYDTHGIQASASAAIFRFFHLNQFESQTPCHPVAGALRHGCGCRLGPPSALQAHCLPGIPRLRVCSGNLAGQTRWPNYMKDLEGG